MSDEFEDIDNDKEQQLKRFKQVAVPIEWHVPDHMRNIYADNFIAQARVHDFVLSFFDTQIPPFAGSEE